MHPSCFIYGSVFVSYEAKSSWHQKHCHILLTAHKYCCLQRSEPLCFVQYKALVMFCNLVRNINALMLGNECRPSFVDTAEARVRLSKVTVKTQSVPGSKHSVWVIKTSQLTLYREIIAVCSQIHTKHKNTLCGQNVELYIKTQSVPRSKHSVSVIKTNQ